MIIYHETVDHDRNSSLGPIVLPGETEQSLFTSFKKKKMHLTFNIFFFSHKRLIVMILIMKQVRQMK